MHAQTSQRLLHLGREVDFNLAVNKSLALCGETRTQHKDGCTGVEGRGGLRNTLVGKGAGWGEWIVNRGVLMERRRMRTRRWQLRASTTSTAPYATCACVQPITSRLPIGLIQRVKHHHHPEHNRASPIRLDCLHLLIIGIPLSPTIL